MTAGPEPSPTVVRLARSLIDPARDEALALELAAWLAASPPFRAFAETHRAKIAKKLRGAADLEALLDVRAELATARLVLADRRFEVAFEAYGSGRGGPDFTITHRAGRPFNLEVTRRRTGSGPAAIEAAVVAKLRQLPPSSANVLLVAIQAGATPDDVAEAAHRIRARAATGDEAWLTARGLNGPRALNDGLLRLAGVVSWSETAPRALRAVWWPNPSARIALPATTARALVATLTA